ncbi:MAG: ferredoxin [Chlamydiae bacterium SM23_39]|nr:MAG: ferredoxin [Chlamydiae bacterium SM23_39]
MAKVIFENTKEEFSLPDGSSIIKPCEKVGINFACGYEGICGSCLIEIVEGMENLNKPTQAEEDFFGEIENKRLACQCKILKNTVKIKF